MYTYVISTVSPRHVSDLKRPSSGTTTETFQQKGQHSELPDIKLSLVRQRVITVDLSADGPLRSEMCRISQH
jgi:hypothetical protein